VVQTEECVLLISDTHIGRITPSYNVDVFKTRIEKLKHNLIKVKETINRSYKLPVLNIFFLGDIVDGENIYPSQPYKQDLDVDDAIDLAVEKFSDFLNFMEKRFREIRIWCVEGNHGRVGKRNSEKTNYDRIFYKRLADRFPVYLSKSWYNHAEIMNHGYLLFHGDSIYSYMNIPFYGIVQRSMRLKVGGLKEDFEVVCMGHFHNVGMLYWNDIKILMNGTMLTDDDFSQKRLGMKSCPKYWFFGVSPERAITWSYLIDL
jgi:predicted phosphodiesterase